jgi:20S proteasome alpha/beta subunit
MTQLFSAVVAEGVVLAGDRKVRVRHLSTGSEMDGWEDKTFEINNRFGVLSCGAGPEGVHVPTRIRELAVPKGATTRYVAEALQHCFSGCHPVPNMTLLVAGYDGERAALLEVNVSQPPPRELLLWILGQGHPSGIWVRGDITRHDPIALETPLATAVDMAVRFLRESVAKHSATVGPPFDVITLTPDGRLKKEQRS